MATSAGGVVAQLIEITKISAESARHFARCNLFDGFFALYTAFAPGGGGDLYIALDLVALCFGNDRPGVCFVALNFYDLEFDEHGQEGQRGSAERPGASFQLEQESHQVLERRT